VRSFNVSVTAVFFFTEMDPKTYFQLFWVPPIASAALMALLWALDGLSRRALLFLASWFLLALVAQYFGTTTSVMWVAGLALQTALAVLLLVKHQLGQL
jgi:4-amino-4-deoxy-L-arabinose transferase-like glycosyltransferase